MATNRRKARKLRIKAEKCTETTNKPVVLREKVTSSVDNAKNNVYYRPDIAETDDEEALLLLM